MVDIGSSENSKVQTYRVAIVGMGPKGLYALERLLAQVNHKCIKDPIEVHIFNSNESFGSGNVYDKNQPHYLIMNYASSNINAWIEEIPKPVVEHPLSFTQWLTENQVDKKLNIPLDFAPRAIVGDYLSSVFQQLVNNCPDTITWYFHTDIVADITKIEGKFQIKKQSSPDEESQKFNSIILTTGHLGAGADFSSKQNSPSFINFVYPTKTKLGSVGSGNIVIRGFGLTCIDTILELTEGRSGTFTSNSSGQLDYVPSGNEPKCIYVTSRSGLPMLPRNSSNKEISSLYYFTEENIEAAPEFSFIDLFLPLIKKEFYFQYYKTLFGIKNRELKFDKNFDVIAAQVTEFHSEFPEEEKYSWDKFTDPFLNQKSISNKQIIEYLKFLVSEAKKGLHESPTMAAAGTWRKISPIFNKYYSFGGMDADSQKLFDTHYFGLFNRLAYGPPIRNTQKLIALGEIGLVDFSGVRNAKITKNEENSYELVFNQNTNSQKSINSEKINTDKIKVDAVINAIIPRGIDKRPDLLFNNLITKGLLRSFKNKNNGHYESNGIDINKLGNAINANGSVENNLSLYGTPTEGVTLDNDTLSRTRNNFASIWAQNLIQDIQNKNKKQSLNNKSNVYKG
ncbi:pyridoxal-phosphate dependent protein [Marivirga lumbricoides]|uniref:Pyridoxal-phosphate dependent protein n=1 Tax=Marivirga lumbricoides TaxID=1046115 RepID=A0A2T4DPG1_9BACT|nr:pyridoxal-phosphate dependent protein [Marivirga lumbricoides]